METNTNEFEKYINAKKRVDNIKSFYTHIVFFVLANIVIYTFKETMIDFFVSKGFTDNGFLNWLELNSTLVPIIWGVILVFSGIYLLKLKPGFFKNWEKRQIVKYMNEEEV